MNEIEKLKRERDELIAEKAQSSWGEFQRQGKMLAEAQEKLYRIEQWCDAYPVDIFPEPDWKRVRALLEAGGMTLDSVSASNMRHVLKGIRKIINDKE